jgi:hypothetical protein
MADDDQLFDEPSDVDAEEGNVKVKGPGRTKIWFTPEAAEETSDRLSTGAMKARGPRYFSKND